jgi:hypothetical protein
VGAAGILLLEQFTVRVGARRRHFRRPPGRASALDRGGRAHRADLEVVGTRLLLRSASQRTACAWSSSSADGAGYAARACQMCARWKRGDFCRGTGARRLRAWRRDSQRGPSAAASAAAPRQQLRNRAPKATSSSSPPSAASATSARGVRPARTGKPRPGLRVFSARPACSEKPHARRRATICSQLA